MMAESKPSEEKKVDAKPPVEKRWHVMAFSTSTKLKDSLPSNNIVVAAFASTEFDLSALKPREEVTVEIGSAFAEVILILPKGARLDASGISVFARLDDFRELKDIGAEDDKDAPLVRVNRIFSTFSRVVVYTELTPEAKAACTEYGLERRRRHA